MGKRKTWYSIKASGSKTATIDIFDEIGEWGVTSRQFKRDLDSFGSVNTINVNINSIGGSVIEGNAIYNILKSHKAFVDATIQGVALSMGSAIAMAADNLRMAENSLMMIHNPYGVAMGDSDELRKQADVIDKMKDTIIKAYVNKTGMDEETISSMMDEETWMNAEEAKEFGFIDEIEEPIDVAACYNFSRQKLDVYKNVPVGLLSVSAAVSKAINDVNRSDLAKDTFVNQDQSNPAEVSNYIEDTNTMNDKTSNPSRQQETGLDEKETAQAVEAALKLESERQGSIRRIFAMHDSKYRDLMDKCLLDQSINVTDASTLLLAEIGKDSKSIASDPEVVSVEDVRDKYRAAAQESFEVRSGSKKNDFTNEFSSYTLLDHARHCLKISNVSTRGMSKMQIVGAAFTHTTSDFPYLLENSIGKELQKAYGNFPETWSRIALVGSVPDFKAVSRIRMGSFNSLDTVPEGLEYTSGTIGEEKETIQAVTKGKMISLTRQTIINDDLNGFLRLAAMLGRAANRTVGNDVYSVITTNAAMNDGIALFHASHNNLAGSGGAMTVTTLGAGRKAMRTQQDPNSNDYLDIRPNILLVPTILEDLANQMVSSTTDPANSNSGVINPIRGFAEVVSDPRLDANSATAWYLLADPSMVPTVEVAFLDGNQTPYLESQTGFTIDGIQWKVRLDYATGAIDFRGAYKNAGA